MQLVSVYVAMEIMEVELAGAVPIRDADTGHANSLEARDKINSESRKTKTCSGFTVITVLWSWDNYTRNRFPVRA